MKDVCVFAILAGDNGSQGHRLAVEGGTDDLGAEGVAVGGIKLLAVIELQMCGQCEQKQPIHRYDG